MHVVAIDACVFIHLMHLKGINNDGHIDALLSKLFTDGYKLLVDSTDRISKDYELQVIPMIKGEYEEGTQRYLLAIWLMSEDMRVNVTLDAKDNLMSAIKSVIYEPKEHGDRAFVYVACKTDADLISNDDVHILGRRRDILKAVKGCGHKRTEIESSSEASKRICNA